MTIPFTDEQFYGVLTAYNTALQCWHLSHPSRAWGLAGAGLPLSVLYGDQPAGLCVCSGVYRGRSSVFLARSDSPKVDFQTAIWLAGLGRLGFVDFYVFHLPCMALLHGTPLPHLPNLWAALPHHTVHHRAAGISGQALSAQRICCADYMVLCG